MIYYIYSGDELLGFIYNSKTYYYHKNMFGDIIGILDSNYNEIVTYEYDSWGALVNITDNSNINLGTINPFRYRSYYYDEETQLYYLNSRYYNPEWGRFINADGVILANQDIISGNLFQYVSNDFVNKADRSGEGFLGVLGGFLEEKLLEVLVGGISYVGYLLPMAFMGVGSKLEATEADLAQVLPKKNEGQNQTIYALRREGEVFYVGRINDLDRRLKEHKKTKEQFDPYPLILNVVNSNIAPLEEQRWIDYYQTLRCGKTNCNKRYEISPRGKRAGEYLFYKKEFDLATGDSGTYIGGCICQMREKIGIMEIHLLYKF